MNIAGGHDLKILEVNKAAQLVQELAHADANIIFGNVIDDSLGDAIRVTVIATGFGPGDAQRAKPAETRTAGEAVKVAAQVTARNQAAESDDDDDDFDVPSFLRNL